MDSHTLLGDVAPLDALFHRSDIQTYYFADTFLPHSEKENSSIHGFLNWKRYMRKPRFSFNRVTAPFEVSTQWAFPDAYGIDYRTTFELSLHEGNVVRLQLNRDSSQQNENSILIDKIPPYGQNSVQSGPSISNGSVSVAVSPSPFSLSITHKEKEVCKSFSLHDSPSLQNDSAIPWCIVEEPSALKRRMSVSFSLSPDEMIFGCGESFTRFNKRGQKITLSTVDALSVQTAHMYKPVPFFMSSNGYGVFINTTTDVTCDFGHTYDAVTTVTVDEPGIDIFIFFGSPKEIISSYTSLTGRSKLPPDWSFGLWMSRISYTSEQEVLNVAKRLRKEHIPCDVLHIDTGWFEEDWQCDYEFSPTRFPNPKKMIRQLADMGFKVSLWQLPYIVPSNKLFSEAVTLDIVVKDSEGGLPTHDAIIDFSSERAIQWYSQKIQNLIEAGVSAIKVDFGEAAPKRALYASGKSGLHEHNLYPFRYAKAVYDAIATVRDDGLIWARSAWAGSQRYPVFWGGDAENTDCAMAATLRGGLSLGVCGFPFWSHDIGGFVHSPDTNLYKRWLAFGMFTSHSRCHGFPPREPWEFGVEFLEEFRAIVQIKYTLMPYILEQAQKCCETGLPMIRPMFLEFPCDRMCWHLDDQYMFGDNLLVGPAFTKAKRRSIYVPEGVWMNLFSKELIEGGRFFDVNYYRFPIIVFVRQDTICATLQEVIHENTW